MSRRGLLSRPGAAVTEIAHVEENGAVVLEQFQDCEGAVNRARLQRDMHGGRRLLDGEQVTVIASIPQILVDQALREGWFHDEQRWAKMLNSVEYRDLRVHEGRL